MKTKMIAASRYSTRALYEYGRSYAIRHERPKF
jgi:hypothetical protein